MADAYIYENGVIHFGPATPYGALKIASGDYEHLVSVMSSKACFGRRGELLVPGVTDAVCQYAAVEALTQFTDWVKKEGGL